MILGTQNTIECQTTLNINIAVCKHHKITKDDFSIMTDNNPHGTELTTLFREMVISELHKIIHEQVTSRRVSY
jgi:hypothetical protein